MNTYEDYKIGWINGLFVGLMIAFALGFVLAIGKAPDWTFLVFAIVSFGRWGYHTLHNADDMARIHNRDKR